VETLELIRLACYGVDIIACFLLVGYFTREYMVKRLRASLAWAMGFFLFSFIIISLASYTTVAVVSRSQVLIALAFAASAVSSLYYGTSLLFFTEGSFFREKITAVFFVVVLLIGSVITYTTPEDQLVAAVGLWTTWIFFAFYIVIGALFYRVSRKLLRRDPRRRAITLVSLAWFIVAIWNVYVGLLWGENPAVEAIMFLFGSFGFILLLYGMTAGKTTK